MWCFRIALSIFLCIESLEPVAAQVYCASVPAVPGPTGYQRRLNTERCEGFYQQQVTGSLEFLSLVNGTINYDLVSDKALIVSVPAQSQLQASQIFLTARALRPGTYYRMDAVIGPTRIFKWPLDAVLAPANLPSDAIGVVGWINRDLGKYYIPLSVVTENVAVSALRPPTMILRSSLDMEALKWRTWQEASGARVGDWVTVAGANRAIIRAGQAVKLELRDQTSGVIIAEIAPKYVNVDRAQTQQIRVLIP